MSDVPSITVADDVYRSLRRQKRLGVVLPCEDTPNVVPTLSPLVVRAVTLGEKGLMMIREMKEPITLGRLLCGNTLHLMGLDRRDVARHLTIPLDKPGEVPRESSLHVHPGLEAIQRDWNQQRPEEIVDFNTSVCWIEFFPPGRWSKNLMDLRTPKR